MMLSGRAFDGDVWHQRPAEHWLQRDTIKVNKNRANLNYITPCASASITPVDHEANRSTLLIQLSKLSLMFVILAVAHF